MSWMRGSDGHQSTMSSYENKLLILCHTACDQGYLKERPLTHHWIPLHRTYTWSHDAPASANPDQVYDKVARVALFVDGKHHRSNIRAKRDWEIRSRLRELGWCVLVVKIADYSTPLKAFRELVMPTINQRVERHYAIPEAWKNPTERQ